MADSPITAYSPFQALATLTGPMGGGSGGTLADSSNPSGVPNMVAALIRKLRGDGAGQPMTGFEGNVASPANPFDSGVYGIQSDPSQQSPAQPQSTPLLPTPRPMQASPFVQGAQPTPFLNGSALFGQPPTG